jgi:transcriptional regulator with XRE-family HTH domain
VALLNGSTDVEGAMGRRRKRSSVPLFADLLREYRDSAGLSQETLAERSRLSVDAISLLERGLRRSPRQHTVELLSAALGLDPGRRAEFVAAARRVAQPPVPDRRRWPFGPLPPPSREVLAGVAGLAVGAAALALVVAPRGLVAGPLHVGSVRARLQSDARSCATTTITVRGIIAIAAGAGALTYHWVRPDGSPGGDVVVPVLPGTRAVLTSFDLAYLAGRRPAGQVRLDVTRPARVSSIPIEVGLACPPAHRESPAGAPAAGPPGPVRVPPVPGGQPNGAAGPATTAAAGGPAPAATAGPTVNALPSARSQPAGTAEVKLGPKHHVIIELGLTGMTPSTTYPFGLFAGPCGTSPARVLDSFTGARVNADGTVSQTISNETVLVNGIPAGSSFRLGAPGSGDAMSAVACADVTGPITQVGPVVTLQVR